MGGYLAICRLHGTFFITMPPSEPCSAIYSYHLTTLELVVTECLHTGNALTPAILQVLSGFSLPCQRDQVAPVCWHLASSTWILLHPLKPCLVGRPSRPPATSIVPLNLSHRPPAYHHQQNLYLIQTNLWNNSIALYFLSKSCSPTYNG